MITNWYTLEKLSLYLNEILSEEVISEAITFNKNELILLNINSANPSIKINLFNPFQFILLEKFSKPKKFVKIFPNLNNDIITSIKTDKQDRNIWINFKNGSAIIVIFRSNSGNIIYINNSEQIPFKKSKNHPNDKIKYRKKEPNFSDILDNFRFNNFWKKNYQKFFNLKINNYKELIEIINNSNGNFVNDRFVLNTNPDLQNFNTKVFYENYKNFIIKQLVNNNFNKEYSKIKNKLLNQLQNNQKSIKHLSNPDKLDKRIEKFRFFGDILSIFQTKINESNIEFEIPKKYQNIQFTNKIMLQPKLNIHQNIKYYYDKAKKLEKRKLESIKENSKFKSEYKRNLEIYNAFAKIKDHKELKLWKKNNKILLQKIQTAKNKQKDNKRVPYKEFITKTGWKIWVGKSAKDNDKMTFELANKNDLWLHSQHTTGSHVIIRKEGKKEIPINIINYAGKLAARYSEEKHANLVPVVHTIKKYVTKRKGFPAGKVTYQFEKSILVNPLEL